MDYKRAREMYENFNVKSFEAELLAEIPELAKPLKERKGNNKYFGGLVYLWDRGIMPCIVDALLNAAQNYDMLKRAFRFIEKMVTENELTQALVFGSFKVFKKDQELQDSARKFMGEQTEMLLNDFLQYEKDFQTWQLSQME